MNFCNELNQFQLQERTLNHPRESKVSLLDKFDKTCSKFRGFLNQIQLIICLQPSQYPNDRTQIELLGSLLVGSALAWFAPLLEKELLLLNDFNNFVGEFKATFGNSEKVRTAANRIKKLIQESNLASSYTLEFSKSLVTWTGGGQLDGTCKLSLEKTNPYTLMDTFVIPASVQLLNKSLLFINALIDLGASACFLDYILVYEYNLPVKKMNTLLSVEVIDDWKISSEAVKTATLTFPIKYNNFNDVFDKKEANRLPEHRPYDCAIDLAPEKQPLMETYIRIIKIRVEDAKEVSYRGSYIIFPTQACDLSPTQAYDPSPELEPEPRLQSKLETQICHKPKTLCA
ncbi:22941_t:CDS:2 [Cetraspora pellucida]|uniref:22941_t:CDS:1 n=1 Tax=Cetraspora pellucida TaxID=1433469 RepID=A0A9N9APP4_9GLOM|nr:22941_t:CDS:2 [Cetraspora pellucida]